MKKDYEESKKGEDDSLLDSILDSSLSISDTEPSISISNNNDSREDSQVQLLLNSSSKKKKKRARHSEKTSRKSKKNSKRKGSKDSKKIRRVFTEDELGRLFDTVVKDVMNTMQDSFHRFRRTDVKFFLLFLLFVGGGKLKIRV